VSQARNNSSYIKYKTSDDRQKFVTGQTEDERTLLRFLQKEKDKADPKKRFCPMCKWEPGETVELIYRDGELLCPECNYKPPESLPAPLLLEGDIKSGNTYAENRDIGVQRVSLTSLANNRRSRRAGRRKNSRMMDILHSVNKIDPFEDDSI
jgi:hypothetical protein